MRYEIYLSVMTRNLMINIKKPYLGAMDLVNKSSEKKSFILRRLQAFDAFQKNSFHSVLG